MRQPLTRDRSHKSKCCGVAMPALWAPNARSSLYYWLGTVPLMAYVQFVTNGKLTVGECQVKLELTILGQTNCYLVFDWPYLS